MKLLFRAILPALLCAAAVPAAARAQVVPDSVVAVTKNGETLLRVNVDGRVGIGTSTPDRKLTVNGSVGADSVVAASGFKFPDGTVQTTAAVAASGTSSNVPNTLVKRDSTGSFAAGKATLDSLAVAGRSALGATSTGRLSASDTVSTSVGIKFGDGSVQTTAATSATGTSANTPNTLVQRDANGSFAAGKATLDSLAVAGRTTLGSGDVIVERVSSLANDADSILTVRNGSNRFRVTRNAGVLAVGTFDSGSSNSVPIEGAGTRMMWYPGKAAFRAGAINGTQWDDANIGSYSVAMGTDVRALGDYAFAGGARAVAANSGTFAFGEDVTATGANSVVMGYKASSSTGAGSPRLGTFVFGDRSTSATGDTVHPTITNSATWRVANGFYIYTASNLASGVSFQSGSSTTSPWCSIANAMISASNCAYLSSGGTWTNSSDVNRKHGFAAVSGEDVLARLRSVPISTWTYNGEADRVRHLGPMAQDFHAAFGLGGSDDTHIATVDADGVALAAAQALDARTTGQAWTIARQQETIAAQQRTIDAQGRELAELRARLDRLEAAVTAAAPKP
ncbi:MAG TPA: tail fiber domain-containing protein [Longimicrobium sp.]